MSISSPVRGLRPLEASRVGGGEGAKANQTDLFLLLQRLLDRAEHGINDLSGLGLGKVGVFRHGGDQIIFVHGQNSLL